MKATNETSGATRVHPEHASFHEVLARELDHIFGERAAPPGDEGGAEARALDSNLFGLALSGGGIRSATLSLGVLQALSSRGWLDRFHYLSTVSGGGYIGSWLSAWIARRRGNIAAVEQALAGNSVEEPSQIQFLRGFSNYLTPRKGLFTVDTWTALATYVRNLALNAAMLVALIAVSVLTLLLLGRGLQGGLLLGLAYVAAGLVICAVATITTGVTVKGRIPPRYPFLAHVQSPRGVIWGLIVALLLASLFGGLWWLAAHPFDSLPEAEAAGAGEGLVCSMARWILPPGSATACVLLEPSQPLGLAVWGGLGCWVVVLIFCLRVNREIGEPDGFRPWHVLAFAVASLVGVAIALFAGYKGFALLYEGFGPDSGVEVKLGGGEQIRRAFALWASVPIVLSAIGAGITLAIGLLGNVYSDQGREWWARVGGWLMIWALGWFVIIGFVFSVPGLVQWAAAQWEYANYALLAGWIAVLERAFAAGRATGTASGIAPRVLMAIAPYVVGLGLLAIVVQAIFASAVPEPIWDAGRSLADLVYLGTAMLMRIDPDWLACAAALAGVAALLLAWRLDVNRFSLHDFYRNRLVRCYLGATQESDSRKAGFDRFTGFWRNDNLPMTELTANRRPYHLVNAALNIVHGKRLAWQERKAASFVFSPLYCGYELPGQDPGVRAYRATASYAYDDDHLDRGITLGTAMAVSGAAVSPNAGYHSTPAFTFLLTLLNARTGAWLPNSAGGRRPASPDVGLVYFLRELFGLTDEKSAYVNVSDGGHFDNLGLYELVRRRCRMIVVVDASADGARQFDDLSASIRKCKVDLGVHIEIDVSRLVPRGRGRRESETCVVVGTVVYPTPSRDVVPETAILVYAKSSLWKEAMARAELRGYSATHPDFPHDTTADQFFDESQFESYRTLGFLVGRTMMGEMDRYLQGTRTVAA